MRQIPTLSAMDRREFLRRTAMAGVGLGLLPLSEATASEPPSVKRYVRLGRTGLEISDIGFGGSRLREEKLVHHALDRGINYFDSAESYTGGTSEEVLGRALRGKRDRAVLVSKLKAGARSSREEMMRTLEGSLSRLQTDRIDIYLNHAVNDVARLQNPEWPEFVAQAKQAGKIRFAGMSGHGGRLVECLDHALDHDLVDVVLVGYNFGQDPAFFQRFTSRLDFVAVQPDLPRVLAKAVEKRVGVVAMKTLRGGRLNDMRPYESAKGTFPQAAFRWVLSSPNVHALVVTMKSTEMIDEYLGASGWTSPERADRVLLERYEARNGSAQCRYGCSDCLSSCPRDVPIPEVLRTRMYADDYGDLDLAREEYARLETGASPCIDCATRTCAGSCPHGIDIRGLLAGLDRRLA